jgi:predicted ATPase/DNA-binding SARP family transcriptional activator
MTGPGLEVRLLGPFEVTAGGASVVIGSPKQRLLLAMLALHGHCSVDLLAEELWDGRPPASLAPTLQSLVSRLRRILTDASRSSEPPVALYARGDGYAADFASGVLDTTRFEQHVESGRRCLSEGNSEGAAARFRAGLALWRGPALSGLSDREFARGEAARLDGLRLDATEELAEAELGAGRPVLALEVLEKHLVDNPLRERAWGEQMLALYRLGRQADALRAYQTVRHVLAEELGLEPTPALAQMEAMILRHDPELERAAVTSRPTALPGPGPAVMAAFLLTDIVASTRRWDDDRAAMATDLARHDSLIRSTVKAHGGEPFSHTGDGLAAAFPSAAAAVAAAVAAQRSLGGERWAGAEPLRVRMAVHVGTVEERDGTFIGPALHRLARLLNMAGGGQILCSGAAADLAREGLPPDVSLLSAGEHALTGFAQPERIHRVLDPELPETLRPELAPPGTRNNLPAGVTSFVGRERELGELDERLAGCRLVTVTGVGGVGKTRLALEAARRATDHFRDGVWLVDLVPVRDPTLVADAVNGTLGLLAGDRPAIDVLCGHLADRSVLLVLDNCEHVVSGVRGVVGAVLARCPDVVVLATSREVLSVPGEALWSTPGLSMPQLDPSGADELLSSDAVGLFVERASTSQPGFALSDANAAAISRICHRLDGLPLALELAAARLRVLGARQLADRLDDRFKTLGSAAAGADPRRRTLRAAMEWSWVLLSPPERAALARLSVFPAGFDLDAAEAVVSPDGGDVLDLIARLVDTSLVIVEPGERAGTNVRYRLLETVRQFAAEQLGAEGSTDETERRHLDYFLSRCEAWRRQRRYWDEDEWVLSAYRDREDYAVALERALATGDRSSAAAIVGAQWPPWIFMGRMASLHERVERTMSPAPAVAVDVAVDSTLGLVCARWESGRRGLQGDAVSLHEVFTEAEATLKRALRTAEVDGEPWVVARACMFLGQVIHWSGRAAEGVAWLRRARQLFAEGGHRGAIRAAGLCDYELGWAALTMGDVAEADALFASALANEERCGSETVLRAHALAGGAVAAAAVGDARRATRLAAEAVMIAGTLPSPGIEAMALCRAAEAAVLSGDVTGIAAAELLRAIRELGGVRWVARGLAVAALAAEARGYPEEAAAALASARHLGEETASTPALARLFETCTERLTATLGPRRRADIENAAIARQPHRALLDAAAVLARPSAAGGA